MADYLPDGQMITTLHIRKGATFIKPFIWKTGDPLTPVDLTEWTARLQIREKAESTEVLIDASTTNNKITLGSAGQIDLVFEEADTENITQTKGVFDLELVKTDTGFVRNLVGGPVIFYPNVTRPT
jgi:hypothetical protein